MHDDQHESQALSVFNVGFPLMLADINFQGRSAGVPPLEALVVTIPVYVYVGAWTDAACVAARFVLSGRRARLISSDYGRAQARGALFCT